jgi:hypothetical protein
MEQGDSCMLYLRSFNRFFLVSLALLGLSVSSLNAATVTNLTDSDLTVYDSTGGTNMDSALSDTDPVIRVFGSGMTQRGVWEYSLSGVTPGASIDSVSVYFEAFLPILFPGSMLLYGYEGDGVASFADGNSTDNLIGEFTFDADKTNGDYNVLLSTSFFQGLIDSAALFAGIVMVSSGEGVSFGPGADICARHSTSSSCGTPVLENGSKLTVNFTPAAVPIPAAVWLFGTALIGLIGFGKRKAAMT